MAEGQGLEYKDYFQFTETVRRIPPHRILAINRGEKEGILKARLEWDAEAVRRATLDKLPLADHPHAEFLKKAAEDALSRLLLPALEREIRRELTEEAEEHAISVFARNLRSLLLQPPLRGRRVLAIDPGFRTGCKLAALDEFGNLLEDAVVYPTGKGDRGRSRGARQARGLNRRPENAGGPEPSSPAPATPTTTPPSEPVVAVTPAPAAMGDATTAAPHGPDHAGGEPPAEAAPAAAAALPESASTGCRTSAEPTSSQPVPRPRPARNPSVVTLRNEAKAKLEELIRKHQLNVIAIGNGTACRETEELVSELIAERLPELAYVIVNEAGASVYSASAVGREEFPDYDATLRGTISIGRRLQDPLSELVKIDPQNIGVGLYQHDVHPRHLKDSLDAVIESCVNQVGVDLNTASVPLLRHVSGLNQLAARELVEYRKQHGPFKQPRAAPAGAEHRAGTARPGGRLPQDHRRRQSARPHLDPSGELSGRPAAARRNRVQPDVLLVRAAGPRSFAKAQGAQGPKRAATGCKSACRPVRDILEALARPGRDPREDLPPPIFKKGILKLEDLQPGMELKGTVLNVVDFGAFVDIGLKDSGLVHISQMANRYIKSPYDVVAVGDVVTVWVLTVDHERRRVSLTMLKPGTVRMQPEKPAQPPRQQRSGRPPRGRRPAPAQGQAGAPSQRQAGASPQGAKQPAAVVATDRGSRTPAAAPQPAVRPRKPPRPTPKPKLSKAALEGAAPLRTFGELKAYFEAQQQNQTAQEDSGKAENGSAQVLP